MFKTYFSSLFIFLMVFSLHSAFAQTGKIAGVVLDGETNEPLPGANILLMGTKLGASTDLEGEFVIINIPPGTYTLEAQMIGYETVRQEGVRISVNRTFYAEFQMKQAVLEGEVITVTVDKVGIKKDQTSSMTNVSSEDIKIMPVTNVGEVVQIQPGVAGSHFRGGRSSEASYMIDGVMVTESFNHTTATVEVTPQAVEDMEVITGTFNAEYGNAMSGVVNVITKDGSEKFEGSGSVNIGNYLTSHKDVFIGMDDTDIRVQDYTFNLSGPLIGNNLSFLVDGRYATNRGYLNGINRFNVNDYSDFSSYPSHYISEANGDGSIVDMDRDNKTYLFGKLVYKPINSIKTSLLYTFNQSENHGYSHYYRFNPNGTGSSHDKSNMVAFHLNHMLSKQAFYELKLSYNKYNHGYYLYENPLDERYVHDIYGRVDGGFFSTGGQDKGHTKRQEERYGVKFDITWQLNKRHSLKSGVDYSQIKLNQKSSAIQNAYHGSDLEAVFTIDPETGKRLYPYYQPEIRSPESIYTDSYFKKPIQFATYLQDKMEFESMVVNLGLRLDYFDPKTSYPTNWRNPANQDYFQDKSRMSEYPSVDPQYYLSPRLGLSYKLGQAALLRFSYGHFLQVPPLNYFYQNSNFIINELAIVGNPLLKAQKTISYEVGLWLQLNEQMDFEVAVYYRDIYDLLSSKLIYTYSQIRYGLYDNKDYGNVRGLEIKYNFRRGNLLLNANYTLQYTRGVADSPEAAFNRAGQDQDPVNKLIPLEWDQRHKLNVLAGYNTEKYGATLLATFSSGWPYTWQPITESPLRLINLLPNNQNRPSQFTVDLQAYYNMFKVKNVNVKLMLLAYNIFDTLNENWVNSTTGRAYTGIVRDIDITTYKSDFSEYNDINKNPSMFAAPRLVRLGLGFDF